MPGDGWSNNGGARQIIHNHMVEIYCAAVFMFKNPKKVKPVFTLALKRLFSRKRYIFNLATPTHGNRGDQMIVLGMEKWCAAYFPAYIYTEFDDCITRDWSYFSVLKLVIKKTDYILLRGGGSVGDWYLDYEYFIRHVLKSYPDNKIVMFPQSVHFSNTPSGLAEKSETAKAYDGHSNFTLNTRDETSYAFAKEMLHHCNVRLCPDIAMFLFQAFKPAEYDRDGIFLCLRNDANEIFYGVQERRKMISTLESIYSLNFGDTWVDNIVSADKRDDEINALLCLFSKSRVAVTDRFHGIICAVLTKTPCVALRSADHKITAGIQWFKDVDSVFYAETIEAVPALVEKAMRCENPKVPDFSKYFNELYEDIVNG